MTPKPAVNATDRLDELVSAVRSSLKYRQVSPELVRALSAAALAQNASFKQAEQAVRARLHQVGAAYLDHVPPYAAWREELRGLPGDLSAPECRQFCRKALACHASTRERLPILDAFYPALFAKLPPLRAVLDLACGLNPLTVAWMGLAPGCTYTGWDIYADMAAFASDFLRHGGVPGAVEVHDLVSTREALPAADLVLGLKMLPCLEQVDRHIGPRLLDAISAPYALFSFPVHSLGGRSKGMAATYSQRFEQLAASRGWHFQRFDFATELAYLLSRTPQETPAWENPSQST